VPGRFIAFEGGDGVGKTTQIALTADWLREHGLDVVKTREPGGTQGAEAIRALLLGGAADRWDARTEALLFAAARADHVARLIRPALAAGQWVLSDRFLDSSRAYQGAASGLGDADILTLHRIGSEGLLPDLTLVLELPETDAQARAADRDRGAGDRIGGRDTSFHNRVAASLRGIARSEPDRARLIDASGSVTEVQDRVCAAIRPLLP